jgi:hypothetical protein
MDSRIVVEERIESERPDAPDEVRLYQPKISVGHGSLRIGCTTITREAFLELDRRWNIFLTSHPTERVIQEGREESG